MVKTAKIQISEKRLRALVAREFKALQREAVDYEGVKTVVNAASKLLKAAEAFKEGSNTAMTNAVTPGLDQLIEILEGMVNNPASYVDKPIKQPKVRKLRQVSDDS